MPKKKSNNSAPPRPLNGDSPGLDPSQRELARFVAQMSECVDDFTARLADYEGDDELYEIDEDSCYCDADEYGSDEYSYPTKAKAKTACMTAVKAAVSDVLAGWDYERNNLIQSVKNHYAEMEAMLLAFIAEFYDSYDEYMTLECTGEIKAQVIRKKEELFGRQLERQAEISGKLHDGFEDLVDTILNMPENGLKNPRDYFDLCGYDSDDGLYCFEMQNAVDAIESDVSSFFAEAAEFPAEVEKSYKGTITELCDMLLDHLKQLRTLGGSAPASGESPSYQDDPGAEDDDI